MASRVTACITASKMRSILFMVLGLVGGIKERAPLGGLFEFNHCFYFRRIDAKFFN
jgi:hypothetical protein